MDKLTQIRLLSLKSIFNSFPLIEPAFLDDLVSHLSKVKYYTKIKGIKRIIGPNREDYDITSWVLIWGMDFERRIYQFLLQKTKSKNKDSQAALVALAPPELGKLFAEYKEKAILRTFSLLNNPSKMKFVIVLLPKGKSIAEEQQLLKASTSDLDKLKFINTLKEMPNIKGEWFPSFDPRCPVCNGMMTELKDYKLGLKKLICPQCGYEKKK
ncbi:MAG: hypothetical protein EU531_07590 [Promethearchaeota archaeon]|nr:MAG: hypothetical protein EU531_07590 [Candidatus Lokiarchaeota archaeon]